jgi:ankyrin repeat protein
MDIWDAAKAGDVATMELLVGQNPRLLTARAPTQLYRTPLIFASMEGHVEVVRWLLDNGAAIDTRDYDGATALSFACREGGFSVVELLMERGADPTIATLGGWTPLVVASRQGHLEVVRFLLGHPRARATLNRRDGGGGTALWFACYHGRGGVARALLEKGADPTVVDVGGTTPMAVAKQQPSLGVSAEGRRECVAALKVSVLSSSLCTCSCDQAG